VDVVFATEAAPGRPNEDHAVASGSFAVVLDGVTRVPRVDTGCRHDPVWLVRTLGALLVDRIEARPYAHLADILADAIEALRGRHGPSCDLANPDSPSATVAIVRERDDAVDYLVLCDSTVLVDRHDGDWAAITDDRTARLPAYDAETVAGLRNTAGGFWVASTRPEAAAHALTGTVEHALVRRVLLCTDGVSRLVERFGYTWPDVLAMADLHGPRTVLDTVRAAERAPSRLPTPARRTKPHDDATLLLCRFPPHPPRSPTPAKISSIMM
jgi:hypothetical protein